MACCGGPWMTRYRVPQLHGSAVAARGNTLPIRAECHATDARVMAAFEGEEFLAGGRVPDLDGVAGAARDKSRSVGTERHRPLVFEGDEVVAVAQPVEVIPFPANARAK